MKKEFVPSNTKFIYTKGELGYAEVLNDFQNASEITIVTYNISEKNNDLLDALKRTNENCKINIITNIPSRWDFYYGDSFRNNARKKITLYLSKLSPEKFAGKANVYFNFSNHGKIIMTNSMIYVGSANYSEESAKNIEFGFISSDENFIDFINSEIINAVESSAIAYYEYDYTALLLEANMILSSIIMMKNKLYEEMYRLHDDIDGEWYYYADFEADLSVDTLDNICKVTNDACQIASDIYDAIDVIINGEEDEIIEINENYEFLLATHSRIEEIRNFDSLIDLSEFDTTDFINEQLQEEYAMEAYEENLQKCIDRASEDSMSIVLDLTQKAKKDFDELIDEVQIFCDKYSDFINNLQTRQIKKINPKIDNT